MESKKDNFLSFSWRVTSLHMMAYLIAGILALIFIDYKTFFVTDSLALLMKPINSPIVSSSRKGLNMVYLTLTKETKPPCPSPCLKITQSCDLNKC